MPKNSSKKHSHQILGVISAARAVSLLLDWVNMPGMWPLRDEGHPELLKFRDAQLRMQRRYGELSDQPGVIGHPFLREFLRKAWISSDTRERDWYLFELREIYNQMARRGKMSLRERQQDDLAVEVSDPRYSPPPIGPLEAALFYFQRIGHRARYCLNKECSAPYFFATRKGQKYCSEKCALPAQQEAKRKWWHANRGKKKR